ncbi:MAG: 16S rRNA (guanine(527)-N(7))-methyltransferase RsmG [Gammaproteobacteria bacterium]|nr:16S rRNA (guanine(527)-N(7))-methyltransferase RsmG [Gammaproteobacteria bacterium]
MQIVDLVRAAATAQGVMLTGTESAALTRYVELVFKWNRIANLTGARTPAEFVNQHIADCLAVVPYLRGRSAADLGSGAGLPGVILACMRPDLEMYLVEPRGKRARFLEQAKIELGLSRVNVIASRIEAWQPPVVVDCVVCRAYGSLPGFIADTAAIQAQDCRLVAMKGQVPHAELATLDPHLYAIQVVAVHLPAWTSRHLILLDRRLPATAIML